MSGTATTPSLTGTPTRSGLNSYAWVNNAALRNWLINSGRGVAMPSVGVLGLADIINFCAAGTTIPHHVMIVSDIDPNNNRCFSGHTANMKNWIYSPGAFDIGGSELYTTTYLFYSA